MSYDVKGESGLVVVALACTGSASEVTFWDSRNESNVVASAASSSSLANSGPLCLGSLGLVPIVASSS